MAEIELEFRAPILTLLERDVNDAADLATRPLGVGESRWGDDRRRSATGCWCWSAWSDGERGRRRPIAPQRSWQVCALFDDESGRMNLDAAAVGCGFLVVSQFTLAASLQKGRRPSFFKAAPGEQAEPLVEQLAGRPCDEAGFEVDTGRFGAHMEVELVNDGPVTFVLEL